MLNPAQQPSVQLRQKQACAEAVLSYISDGMVLGMGTGSTVNCLLAQLPRVHIKGIVASSQATADKVAALGIELLDLNAVQSLDLYIDGADEITGTGAMIKGGGGALTGEKMVSAVAKSFICLADSSKWVERLGRFPVAVEVLPQARSYVARELVKLGGQPLYRQGFISDYGNVILDVHGLVIDDPKAWEERLNNVVGVVCNGIFATQKATQLLLASPAGVDNIHF